MKVCIVTVYNSINSGSFWQAYTLGKVIKEIGHEVVYLKIKENKNVKIKKMLSQSLKYGIDGFCKQKKVYSKFKECLKEIRVIPNKIDEFDNIDVFVLGSDTIWNLDSKNLQKQNKIFFGGRFKGKKVVSYAASIANTSEHKIADNKEIIDMLNDLQNISVRDQYTYDVINKVIEKDIQLVCDPTLLLAKDDYKKIANAPNEEKYIFLYLFSELSKEQIQDIKKFAQKNNLKIISGVNDNEYSDKCIINEPNTFLNYMMYADYIVTDTFHGVIFSANLGKNFVVINKNKKKVNDFVNRVELNNRLVNTEVFSDKFESINYDKTNEKICQFREKSMKYLKEVLK